MVAELRSGLASLSDIDPRRAALLIRETCAVTAETSAHARARLECREGSKTLRWSPEFEL